MASVEGAGAGTGAAEGSFEVRVLHNWGEEMLWSYSDGDLLAEADVFVVRAHDSHGAAEAAWVVCNVDDATQLPSSLQYLEDAQRRYRMRGNRSMSTGDVVVVTPQDGIAGAWVAAQVGFSPLGQVPTYVADDSSSPRSASALEYLARST